VLVADDGIGLPEGMTWPKPGKLSALIARSLQQNARATMAVESAPGAGTRVTIDFRCEDAVPSA
jgi:two-component sensor histidine kinase